MASTSSTNRDQAKKVGIGEAPSNKKLKEISYKTSSNKFASDDQLEKIAETWKEMGIAEGDLSEVAILLARMGADYHTSEQTSIPGNCPKKSDLSWNDILSAVRKHCTFHQFGMKFANCTWNMMLLANGGKGAPPANSYADAVPRAEAFGAWDCFEGVGSEAAIMPTDGIVKKPSEKESAAHQAFKQLKLHEAQRRAGANLSNALAVTGGRGALHKLEVRTPGTSN